jgi:hypothetical protein
VCFTGGRATGARRWPIRSLVAPRSDRSAELAASRGKFAPAQALRPMRAPRPRPRLHDPGQRVQTAPPLGVLRDQGRSGRRLPPASPAANSTSSTAMPYSARASALMARQAQRSRPRATSRTMRGGDRIVPISRPSYGHGWFRTSDLSRVKRYLRRRENARSACKSGECGDMASWRYSRSLRSFHGSPGSWGP